MLKVPDSPIREYKYFIIYRWRVKACRVSDDKEGIQKSVIADPASLSSPSLVANTRMLPHQTLKALPCRTKDLPTMERILKNKRLCCLELLFDSPLHYSGYFYVFLPLLSPVTHLGIASVLIGGCNNSFCFVCQHHI